MRYNSLTLAILGILCYTPALATDGDDVSYPTTDLGSMEVTVNAKRQSSLAFDDSQKASDLTVGRDRLKHRSATLGNALAGETGIHSNPFGGGASAPVVRGQEGVRVKILQNGMGVADMSTVSPDHAVAVDTLLSSRVEVVRGASTLMYSNASPAGVINVIDGRIPSVMPDGATGEMVFRFNTGSDEKVATAGLSVPVGESLALRIEGMKRDANPYNVPAIDFGEVLDYLPDSYNNSTVGTIGLSYIGNQGHVGMSYSERRDDYGLVGHNHKFDNCEGHVIDTSRGILGPERKYLIPYPHLMNDDDLVDGLHFHCGTDYDLDPSHSHTHVYGHKHDHTQKGPWVEMLSKSFSLQGEILNPIPSLDKIRLSASHSDYTHQEYDEGKHIPDPSKGTVFVQGNTSYWGNKGLSAKATFYHSPTNNLSIVWGTDLQSNKTYALIPDLSEKVGNRRLLVTNTQKTGGLFGLTEYAIGNLKLHSALRYERTRIPVYYNMHEIDAQINQGGIGVQEYPDLTSYRNQATSYAVGAIWDITPRLRLDASYSHNERTPTPMELYYHGKHLATNSFLYGNKNLNEERSDNLEFGFAFSGDKWSVKGSVYGNNFDNYIHPENLYKNGNLTMRRFTQSRAKIRGAELEIGYRFNSNLRFSVFGDTVRGRLFGFVPITGTFTETIPVQYDPNMCDYLWDDPNASEDEIDACEDELDALKNKQPTEVIHNYTIERPDRHAPRMSPDRFGFRINGEYGSWSPSLEYIRVQAQNRTSDSVAAKYNSECTHHNYGNQRLCPIYVQEDATAGYNLLNLGLDYHGHFGRMDYTWSVRANNLLNEKVYVHNSFLPFVPQQGRNLSLALTLNF